MRDLAVSRYCAEGAGSMSVVFGGGEQVSDMFELAGFLFVEVLDGVLTREGFVIGGWDGHCDGELDGVRDDEFVWEIFWGSESWMESVRTCLARGFASRWLIS